MRPAQPGDNNRVGFHIDDDAAVSGQRAKSLLRIGLREGGGVADAFPFGGETVQVTAVLGHQLRNERRSPERHEALCALRAGKAGEQRVREHHARPVDRHLVDHAFASAIQGDWHEDHIVLPLQAGHVRREPGRGCKNHDVAPPANREQLAIPRDPHRLRDRGAGNGQRVALGTESDDGARADRRQQGNIQVTHQRDEGRVGNAFVKDSLCVGGGSARVVTHARATGDASRDGNRNCSTHLLPGYRMNFNNSVCCPHLRHRIGYRSAF